MFRFLNNFKRALHDEISGFMVDSVPEDNVPNAPMEMPTMPAHKKAKSQRGPSVQHSNVPEVAQNSDAASGEEVRETDDNPNCTKNNREKGNNRR